jgi:hypothetical protein
VESGPAGHLSERGDYRREQAMSVTERLFLNGFTTVSEMLANDRLAFEEVRQVLEVEPTPDQSWLAPRREGLEAGIGACFGH